MDAGAMRQCLHKNSRKLVRPQRVIITPGEPAGIGPELVVYLAQLAWPVELVVCADGMLLQKRAAMLGLPLTLLPYDAKKQPLPQEAATITLLSISLRTNVVIGELNAANGQYVIDTLIRACNGCINGEFAALITGPVHKGILNKAGIRFTGHTEFFEQQFGTQKVVMMLVTEKLRVALVTTHIPIQSVSNAITPKLLRDIIKTLHDELQVKFCIERPRIVICGLNPHAGEGGYIGMEEINTIIPVINEMRAEGIDLSGPISADTFFQPKYLNHADVVLSMYHDQILPVLKCQSFGHSVNITLGLPFIRTSVDHGTALDLVGHGRDKGKANASSFIMALNLAIKIINNMQ